MRHAVAHVMHVPGILESLRRAIVRLPGGRMRPPPPSQGARDSHGLREVAVAFGTFGNAGSVERPAWVKGAGTAFLGVVVTVWRTRLRAAARGL
ncbi:MAG: hypothetical protein HY704_09225 [Gemmatimonadetes bacterium]|nr:hypothetical protein [Gemmatimonadota bacterium]